MYISNNRGLVLFVTFIILMLISMGAVLILLGVSKYTSVTEAQIQRLEAITLAEAGLNYAYWYLRANPGFTGILPATAELPAGTVQITVSLNVPGRYKIESKVTY